MDYKRLLTISMIAASVTTMQAQSFETAQEAVTNMGVGRAGIRERLGTAKHQARSI